MSITFSEVHKKFKKLGNPDFNIQTLISLYTQSRQRNRAMRYIRHIA
jgi:hypothetical protein